MSDNGVTTASRLERAAFIALAAFAAALQISIAIAQILLTVAGALWVALLITRQERITVPRWSWFLGAYAGLTLMSAMMSLAPITSITDSKQLLLFLIVPGVYRLARGRKALTIATVIISVGAASAIVGIVQYGILEYDNLGSRPQGLLTHYMTYSGLLMLVAGMAAARLLFHGRDRTWPALVLPALLVALALTFTRSAMVGTCVGSGMLLVLKDFRLLALAPIVAVLFIAVAPEQVTARLYSTFDLQDKTARDRVAMIRTGVRLVRDYPVMGVGPDMVKEVYADYRDPAAVQESNPHLHNVPIRARDPCALGVDGAGRGANTGPRAVATDGYLPFATGWRPSSRRQYARCRYVRIQLRRLGILDAVARAGHAAVRRRCGYRD